MTSLPRSLISIVFPLFIIVVLLPIILMVIGSFWSDGLTLSHYAPLLNDRYLKIGLNSVLIAFGTTFFSLLIGIPQAFLLQRTNFLGKGVFKIAYLIPLLIPPYIHAIVWMHLLGKTGLINQCLASIFSLKQPFFTIYGISGTILVLTLAYHPVITALVISGLKSLDYRLEEAARLHHASFQVFKKITVPLLTPHIVSGAIFVFVFSMTNFGVPDFLRVRVYPMEIFIQFSAFYNEKAATALSVPLVAFTILLILLIKKFMKNRPYVTITGAFKHAPSYGPGKNLHILAFLFILLIFLLSTIVPIVVLINKSGAWSNYSRVLSTSMDEIGYSMVLAFLGSFFMVVLSFFVSYLIERSKGWSSILEYSSLIPFAVPATVLGIGLIKLWNRPFTQVIYGSSLIILIAYVAHFVPFTIRIILSDMKKIAVDLEEVAFLTTSRWFHVMKKIVVPLARPGLLASFFIGFVLCFGDLSTTLLTIPPGRETVPIKIYNLMHYGAEHLVSALCVIIVSIILIMGGVFYLCYWKWLRYD